ncbi:MAG TPA: NADH-ubiquinone oxidoreductase-F iron-sulfur binding region domain-containing protein, partial [Acidimicrobiia bacterium]
REQAAVDGLLGPPASGWEGAARSPLDGHVSRGGRKAREQRTMLLPVLHALQSEVGWISPGGMNYACRRLTVPPAEAYGVASFYALFSVTERPDAVAHVCDDIVCLSAGAEDLRRELRRLGPEGDRWVRSPCLGMCESAPAAFVQRAGRSDVAMAPANASRLGELLDPEGPYEPEEHATGLPQFGKPGLRLLRRMGHVDPESIDDYRVSGGYGALRRAFELGPGGVIREVNRSGLVGRGGAAFPAGVKWEAVAAQPATPKYVICNADESEPGTFKDRVLMEGDPFAVVEAMTIAGTAVGARHGYLYIRGEYPLAVSRLLNAIEQARERGLLGEDVLGSGLGFDIELRRGAGAYICGEETALMNSIEGFRGEPRNKPPFPTEHGLFGRPTLINNVETLVCVLDIVSEGGDSFAAIGTEGSTGTKLFCLSGSVRRPGVYEVPFGATAGELVEMAGGPHEHRTLAAVLVGGAAGGFLRPDQLEIPLTFEGAKAAGLAVGSGAVIAFDETVDLAHVVRRIAAFFRDESCGQCVPCRVGTVRQEEALTRLLSGSDRDRELGLLVDIGQVMNDASICGLGQTASAAVQSALRLGLIPAGT